MTEVSFHTGVADLLDYGCRLLRKAMKKGSRAAVCADGATLARLDGALWTFDPLEFVPHLRVARGAAPPPRLAATPILLIEADDAEALRASALHEVLVNLGPAPVTGFESFERVIELVARDAEAVAAGRRRWRHYGERGYAITHHDAVARERADRPAR